MILQKKSSKGKKYFGCENNPDCDFMTWDEPLKEKCEVCGSIMLKNTFRGHKKIKCSNPDCKSNAVIKNSVAKKGGKKLDS